MDSFLTVIGLFEAQHASSQGYVLAFSVLVVTWLLSELFIGKSGLSVQSVKSDRGSAVVFVLAVTAGITLAFEANVLGWLPIGAMWARWLGIVAMVAGLALRIFSILWLGTMFTRFVRHPSYSGLLLFFLGMGFALGDWLSVAALALLPTVGIAYRIMVEERALLAAFGEEYRAYMGKVHRLVPFVF